MKSYLFVLWGWLTLMMISCVFDRADRGDMDKPDDLEKEIKMIYHTGLTLPDRLLFYPKTDSPPVREKDSALVVYIDADCLSCFDDLIEWKKIVHRYPEKYDYVFVVASSDTAGAFILLKKWGIDFPVGIDTASRFLKNNYVSGYKLLQAYLVDKNNEILFIGNPLYSENVKKRLFPSGE